MIYNFNFDNYIRMTPIFLKKFAFVMAIFEKLIVNFGLEFRKNSME